MNEAEISLLRGLHEATACSFFDAVLPGFTALGNHGAVGIALALVLLLIPKTRKLGLHVALALIFGLILCNGLLKPLVHRIRPYDFDPSLILLIPPERDLSFPSGHTAAAFECAVSIFAHDRRWGAAALVFAVLMAFSRLYLTVHYPTDVLAGMVIGVLCAVFAGWVTEKLWPRLAGMRYGKGRE